VRAAAVAVSSKDKVTQRILADNTLLEETKQFWREYSKGERDDMLRIFTTLARDGALAPSDAEDIQDYLKDRTWEDHTAPDGTVTPVPKFKSHLGRFAYVVNELAAKRLPIRVGACQRCHDLFWQPTTGRSRPRLYCEANNCAQLIAAAKWKERNPDWRTRKPKSIVRRKK